jgi:hypothetical protein
MLLRIPQPPAGADDYELYVHSSGAQFIASRSQVVPACWVAALLPTAPRQVPPFASNPVGDLDEADDEPESEVSKAAVVEKPHEEVPKAAQPPGAPPSAPTIPDSDSKEPPATATADARADVTAHVSSDSAASASAAPGAPAPKAGSIDKFFETSAAKRAKK